MRLACSEIEAIVASVLKFDDDAEIYLFGSRVDDTKRGGDIDILILSDVLHNGMLHLVEDELFRHIDEQKVDLVLAGKTHLTPFAAMVLSKGAERLCPKRN